MIFILTEQVLNGTVTMDVMVSGVEATSFTDAVATLCSICEKRGLKMQNERRGEKSFAYSLPGKFQIYGHMDGKPLKMLE